MKKQMTGFALLFLFSIGKINAQITITSVNMPASGDTIRYSTCSPTSISYTATGANTFWNYGSLIPTGQGMYNYKAASSTPYFLYFLGGDYGLKIADSINLVVLKLYNVYDFYKNTAASFETKGMGFTYSSLPLGANYSTPDILYSFPLTYLNHDSTPYRLSIALTSTLSYSQTGYRITDVDGWGIIKTPYDSVPCIRVVSTAYGTDSIHYGAISLPVPDVKRSYKWLSLTEKIPVLELDGTYTNNTFVPTQVIYRDAVNRDITGINKIQALPGTTVVYPNPSSGEIYFYTPDSKVSFIELYDISGALVASNTISGLITKFSLGNLAKGSYFYRILDKKKLPYKQERFFWQTNYCLFLPLRNRGIKDNSSLFQFLHPTHF